MGLKVEARQSEGGTCPYCHDVLDSDGDDTVRCPGCSCAMHQECYEENEGCTSLGCKRNQSSHWPECPKCEKPLPRRGLLLCTRCGHDLRPTFQLEGDRNVQTIFWRVPSQFRAKYKVSKEGLATPKGRAIRAAIALVIMAMPPLALNVLEGDNVSVGIVVAMPFWMAALWWLAIGAERS